jgi:hypothetical protein
LWNRIAAGLLLLASAAPLRAELLQLSLLKREARHFTLRLDLFQGGGGAGGEHRAGPAATAEAPQKSVAEEIAQSVFYEGFIVKNAKRSALLSVSGEFFSVSEGDTILGKIKVLKISKDMVTIEYDGHPYEIRIKGDQNG